MTHHLPDLPYAKDALEPHMSRETLDYHHGKHHASYVEKLNGLIEGTEYADITLEDIVTRASDGIFNNAAQAWNHTFFWNCLTPRAKEAPGGKLADAIDRDFGGTPQLREQMQKALTTLFGSGWVWLVRDADGKLAIRSLGNAGNPLTDGEMPILTCDAWEHAFYIDYRNAKPKYFEGYWALLNWEFAEMNYLRDEPFRA